MTSQVLHCLSLRLQKNFQCDSLRSSQLLRMLLETGDITEDGVDVEELFELGVALMKQKGGRVVVKRPKASQEVGKQRPTFVVGSGGAVRFDVYDFG